MGCYPPIWAIWVKPLGAWSKAPIIFAFSRSGPNTDFIKHCSLHTQASSNRKFSKCVQSLRKLLHPPKFNSSQLKIIVGRLSFPVGGKRQLFQGKNCVWKTSGPAILTEISSRDRRVTEVHVLLVATCTSWDGKYSHFIWGLEWKMVFDVMGPIH